VGGAKSVMLGQKEAEVVVTASPTTGKKQKSKKNGLAVFLLG